MELKAKISIKEVCGEIKVNTLEDGKIYPLMTVYGIVRNLKTGKIVRQGPGGDNLSQEYTGLVGEFEAVRASDKEVFRSAKCFLPKNATELIEGSFDVTTKSPLSFGFEISVKYDQKSTTKYVYVIKPLLKPTESSPLLLLANQIKENQS